MTEQILTRPLLETDLSDADRIVRIAFGTFLGLPDPSTFMGDAAYVKPRWQTYPDGAFAAEVDGTLAGSSFATDWGSFGFFGPLTVRPDLWNTGVAKRLMEPMIGTFEEWGTKHAGLFTFAHSPKHVALYQKFGFWPRFLTAIMSKPVGERRSSIEWSGFSRADDLDSLLKGCLKLTDSIYEGLDLQREIIAVRNQKLGETVVVQDSSSVDGFAVCHFGAGTEGGSGRCYIKFAAARTERTFDALLDACEDMAFSQNLKIMVAGVNTARHEAHRQVMAAGFRTDFIGVAMQRPNEPGYNRPGVFILDDWR
jgi:GNAT superfamily N-acetyltransferase